MPCYAMTSLQCACSWAARLRVVMTARSRSPLLLINQPLAFLHASPYPATARLRDCAPAIDRAAAIAAVHEYLPMYTRVYAHALRAATDSETSIFDHEQVGTMGWQCSVCNIQVDPGSVDTSKCAVSHNCLRTCAILTLCKILNSSHCTVCTRF